ncbi:MAG: hypothetical protein JWQ37_1862 [Blastococcus sp.]|nr:hypothetical protein [Blastococcus sp.]
MFMQSLASLVCLVEDGGAVGRHPFQTYASHHRVDGLPRPTQR